MKQREEVGIRDNLYAESILYDLWEDHFEDVPRKNLVLVLFGRYSVRRLGSIKWVTGRTKVKSLLKSKQDLHKVQDDPRVSVITLTKYFTHGEIPDQIVKMTVAHEMVHYAHGFHSPLPKLYEHPHRGNIVNKELIKRGLKNELEYSEVWLKDNWYKTVRLINSNRKGK